MRSNLSWQGDCVPERQKLRSQPRNVTSKQVFFWKPPGKIALTFGRARPGFEALTTAEQHRERSEDCETREPEIKQDE